VKKQRRDGRTMGVGRGRGQLYVLHASSCGQQLVIEGKDTPDV
jgi:hypothetical protein